MLTIWMFSNHHTLISRHPNAEGCSHWRALILFIELESLTKTASQFVGPKIIWKNNDSLKLRSWSSNLSKLLLMCFFEREEAFLLLRRNTLTESDWNLTSYTNHTNLTKRLLEDWRIETFSKKVSMLKGRHQRVFHTSTCSSDRHRQNNLKTARKLQRSRFIMKPSWIA